MTEVERACQGGEMCLLPTANEHTGGNGPGAEWHETGQVFMYISPVYLGVVLETGLPSCTAVDDLSSLTHCLRVPSIPLRNVLLWWRTQILSPSLPGESPSCRGAPLSSGGVSSVSLTGGARWCYPWELLAVGGAHHRRAHQGRHVQLCLQVLAGQRQRWRPHLTDPQHPGCRVCKHWRQGRHQARLCLWLLQGPLLTRVVRQRLSQTLAFASGFSLLFAFLSCAILLAKSWLRIMIV